MADNASSLFHLELIRRRDTTEQEANVLGVLARWMQSATLETAAGAAHQLDCSCPPLGQEEEATDYLWTVWEIIINIARSPDVAIEVQEHLVSIMEGLQQCAKGDLNVCGVGIHHHPNHPISAKNPNLQSKRRVWRDLPLLPMCLEAAFSDPFSEGEEFNPESAQIWRNLNTFGARCLGAGVAGPYPEVMRAMLSALEEDLSTAPDVRITECKIQVACEWVSHAARPLLWWARDNIGCMEVFEDDTENDFARGPLYQGPATVCLRRWGFWLGRFGELGKEEFGMSEDIRKAAGEAAMTMHTNEGRVANTLNLISRQRTENQ